MDGLEKNAIVHVCLEHVNHMEVCKEAIRTLLKDCGFQNVTIEVDEDLATHRAQNVILKSWKWVKIKDMVTIIKKGYLNS